jgi:hypothetical protein
MSKPFRFPKPIQFTVEQRIRLREHTAKTLYEHPEQVIDGGLVVWSATHPIVDHKVIRNPWTHNQHLIARTYAPAGGFVGFIDLVELQVIMPESVPAG